MIYRSLLRQRSYALPAAVIAVVLAGFYYVLSMRKAKPTNLLTTKLASPGYDIHQYGATYYFGNLFLDLVLGSLTAVMIVTAVYAFRAGRSGAKGGSLGPLASIAFAVATFGCPTCVLPLAGSLGIGVFASALPLLGTEFKLASLALLALSMWWLDRKLSRGCETPIAIRPPVPRAS